MGARVRYLNYVPENEKKKKGTYICIWRKQLFLQFFKIADAS